MIKDDIVILGAGLAGLSTAYHLQTGYSIFEKEKTAGGMARSIHKDGYIFDYDGHLLHFRNDYTFSLAKQLLNGNLALHKRSSWIYSKSTYTKYPFQANFYGLPMDVVRDCLVGLIKSKLTSSHNKIDIKSNFEAWICNTFGNGIAEHFMLPYNKKFWTVDVSELTCDWLDGFVPVPSLEDTVTGAISDDTKAYGYNSRFWYPIKGGISELSNGLLSKIKSLYTGKRAGTIDQYRKDIIFEDGTIKKFETLINTIPLPELSKLLVNLPKDVENAFLMLKWTSVFVLNLGIKKDGITDKHWIYYPEEETIFYRIGFPTSFSMDAAPPKRTSMYVEISYPGDKDIDADKVTSDTISNLKELGFITDEKDIEVCLPIDIKYGYVIYDKNREKAMNLIKSYLKRFGIHTIGRYGGWRYMSMEDVILEGKEVAASLRGACYWEVGDEAI